MDTSKLSLDVGCVECPSNASNPLAKYEDGIIYVGGLPHPRYSFKDVFGEGKIDVVVNLMEESELRAKGDYRNLLASLPKEVCYLHFPIPDRTIPSVEYLEDILRQIAPHLGKNIYVHCLGGNGRSMMVGCALVGKFGKYPWDRLHEHLVQQHTRREFRRYEPLSDPGQLDFLKGYLETENTLK
jgi:protein-tyrosine phosphatase